MDNYKIIKLNTCNINEAITENDKKEYPWKLKCIFRIPDFMNMMWLCILGGSCEELIVIGKTKKDLENYMKEEQLNNHPRLLSFNITKMEEIINDNN